MRSHINSSVLLSAAKFSRNELSLAKKRNCIRPEYTASRLIPYPVVLDSCVIFPMHLRDTLLRDFPPDALNPWDLTAQILVLIYKYGVWDYNVGDLINTLDRQGGNPETVRGV